MGEKERMIEMRNTKYEMPSTKYGIRDPGLVRKKRKRLEEMIEIGICGLTKWPRRWRHLLIGKRTKMVKRSDISAIWWHHWELTGQVEIVDRARPNEGETQRATWWPILQVVVERETKLGHLRLVDALIPDPMPETSSEHSLGRSHWHQ